MTLASTPRLDWSFAASSNSLLQTFVAWVLDFESIAAAWAAGDRSRLQPTMANWTTPVSMILRLFRTAVTKREKDLLGMMNESGGGLALMAAANAASDAM